MRVWATRDGVAIEDRNGHDVEVSVDGDYLRIEIIRAEDGGMLHLGTELDRERVAWLHQVLGQYLATWTLPAPTPREEP